MNCKSILSRGWVVIIYLSLVCLYFCRKDIGLTSQLTLDITKTIPVLFLSIATLFLGNRRLFSLALLLSAAGDLAGEHGAFLPQIALFAVAHIAYIICFVSKASVSRRALYLLGLWSAILLLFGSFIVVNIDNTVFKVACAIYIAIIGTMAATTLFISSMRWWIYTLGALIFVVSDSCIAWNKFIERFDGAGFAIMSTYFAAQLIFTILYLKEQK